MKNKSEKTQKRIDAIKIEIMHRTNSINSLKYHSHHYFQRIKHPYAPRLVKYSAIPKCEKRFRFTLKNLTDQIALLENELATLVEYGV